MGKKPLNGCAPDRVNLRAQNCLNGEIIVDNFAGGGGASTGLELAFGRVVDAAINHDPSAILMHRTNHPYTEHYQASVWDIDPRTVCRGRPVGVAWFSPDCKHFSKAKGAALVDKKIRGLAWITLRWAGVVRPRVIFLENVEEFQTWGPVRKGKPVKKKAGQTFRRFIQQFRDLGYQVEWRELVAADYGAPTTRKRFVLIARCDGRPVVWPEPTHAPRDSEAVRIGKLLPWRSAAEIIDWSLPCPSVFESKAEIMEKYGLRAVRPLRPNTMRRVIRGVDKFTIRSTEPYIVPWTVTNTTNSVGGQVTEPVHTVTTAGNQMLVTPTLVQVNHTGGDRTGQMAEPLPTVTAKLGYGVAAASLIQYHTEQTERVRASGLRCPLQTIDASNRYALTSAQLVEYYGNGNPLDVREPLHTVTSHDREAVVSAHIQKFFGGVVGEDAKEPLPTVTTKDRNALCAAHVVKFKRDELGTDPRVPLPTLTTSGSFAVCKALLCKISPEDNGTLHHWPEIRALLNQHCGYQMSDNDLLLLDLGGAFYYIADIGLRMLTPRELYNAMGFPPDYIIEQDDMGNPYPKKEQVARCGNAVCPPMAAAVARANLPEWCSGKIKTMKQLKKMVAV